MTKEIGRFNLIAQQEEELDDIKKAMKSRLEDFKSQEISGSEKRKTNPFEDSNIFGLFGPRGLGKTTLLRSLFNTDAEDERNSEFVFLTPIDCTSMPSLVAPSTAVLQKAVQYCSHIPDGSLKPGGDLKKETDRLREIAGEFMVTTKDSLSLNMELSGSVKEFASNVIHNLERSMGLKGELSAVLSQIFSKLKGKEAFAVLLDDFDLILDKHEIRRWMQAMLDELRQSRLFILLTADLHRLQNLSHALDPAIDPKTGRALVYKMLPTANRVVLRHWGYHQIKGFQAGHDSGLFNIIDNLPGFICKHKALIVRMLPAFPRGLGDFRTSLLAKWNPDRSNDCDSGKKDPGNLPSDRKEDDHQHALNQLREFLGILASCRQEALLARDLVKRRIYSWVKKLPLNQNSCNAESWVEVVLEAKSRRVEDNHKASLMGPLPLWGGSVTGKKGTSAKGWRDEGDFIGSPLKDVQKSSKSLWAELLVNIGFTRVPDTNDIRWVSNRTYFCDYWEPIAERINGTSFTQQFATATFFDYLDDPVTMPTNPCFFWISLEINSKAAIQSLTIGWKPFLQILRGKRDNTLTRYRPPDYDASIFNHDPHYEKGAKPHPLEVLPSEVWSMILLVDGLDRVPWEAFSKPKNWFPITLVCLAAALVRSAYVYGLCQCGVLTRENLKKQQKTFLKVLDQRDPASLLSKKDDLGRIQILQEEEMQELLLQLFYDDLPLPGKDSLSEATRAFLDSDAYKMAKSKLEPMAPSLKESSE